MKVLAAAALATMWALPSAVDAAPFGDAHGCSAEPIFAHGFEAPLHPLYPPLNLSSLPGDGGAASGRYTPPILPCYSRSIVVTGTGSTAAQQLRDACTVRGTAVEVPSSAARLGVLNLGLVEDCDIQLAAAVVIDRLVVGSLPGPTHAPSHRIRIRGGQIGSMLVYGGSTDLVFDGVAINNGAVPSTQRAGTAMYLPTGPDGAVVDRFAVVNSFIRMLPVAAGADLDGTPHLSERARNLLFANNNIVTAGNRNSWGFRISGGENVLIIDNSVRVSFHKLVRMNDHPVDYVYIKGGLWMRERTLTSGGALLNDAFAQLGGSTTDRIFIHDPAVYLLPEAPAAFGASVDAGQSGRSWETLRIAWHTVGPEVISDTRLQSLADACASVGGLCDYGIGSHSYHHDPALQLPPQPWRDLPDFVNDDPDVLPVEP